MIFKTTRTIVFVIMLSAILRAPAYASQQVMSVAPDVSLKSPTGEAVSLTANRGKGPILLAFWASWCPHCRDEIARLNKLDSEGVTVIAVNEGESAWKTKRFVAKNNIHYQVALDPDGSVAKAFQVPGVPACVVLNKSGQIVYRSPGGLTEQIESYLAR